MPKQNDNQMSATKMSDMAAISRGTVIPNREGLKPAIG
jgi:hypothetical protein